MTSNSCEERNDILHDRAEIRNFSSTVEKYFTSISDGKGAIYHVAIASVIFSQVILGNPGADSRGEGKSKRAGKYGTKKSKEQPEEPWGQWGQCLTRPVPNGRHRSGF